ncbi:MAG: AmmeMemoRadiSam system radical SAM enzyme [Chlorobiaceae bacterium]|nr:AmmeMemoRadiSam system radical SAM enzyme [Chlorobiaceae bacterium]
MGDYTARYWHAAENGRLQCDLCPRKCTLSNGQHGVCLVRMRKDDRMILTTYGRVSSACVDPIEKKPLYHFYPGSGILSIGTIGCNLTCRFCQNSSISRASDLKLLQPEAGPEIVAQTARKLGCKSVAFTYNDPVVFAEYAMDVADACHALDIRTVAVTAGYMCREARRDFYSRMDAANVDLKAFSDEFYTKLSGVRLQPVLDTLTYLKHETAVWLEITTLLIPGWNDSDDELTSMATWIRRELGPEVPLHFSAFWPTYKLTDVPPTPVETLVRARDIARRSGLHYVYIGNLRHAEGATTSCPTCNLPLIARDGHQINLYKLSATGSCPQCATAIAGHFDPSPGNFSGQRQPLIFNKGNG